ncbi:MAG: hypothetical protein OXI96_03815 [Acidimicrobiaceae bacterium]|nr:hypothetical protein [Acidimicrobiaceae bacterium]
METPTPDDIMGKLEVLDGRFDKIDGRLDRMDGRFDKIDEDIAKIHGDIGTLKTIDVEIIKTISVLQDTLTVHNDRLATNTVKIDALSEKLERVLELRPQSVDA